MDNSEYSGYLTELGCCVIRIDADGDSGGM